MPVTPVLKPARTKARDAAVRSALAAGPLSARPPSIPGNKKGTRPSAARRAAVPEGRGLGERSRRSAIDLLVAGAHGDTRPREAILGGVSRTLIHQMMVPVLLSH